MRYSEDREEVEGGGSDAGGVLLLSAYRTVDASGQVIEKDGMKDK